MATVAMSGNDSIIINNVVMSDLADGDCVMLTFPSEIATLKVGKNGNTIYGLNETGKQCEVKLRVIRGSADDKFLNNLLTQQQANFAGFPLMIGEFIKLIGDGSGNILNDTYVLAGGVFNKQIEGKSNVEGDSLQSVAEYTLRFSSSPRALT